MADPDVQQVAEQVELVPDPEAATEFARGRWYNKVTIRLKGGKVLEQAVAIPRGHAQNPMTKTELVQKFLSLASSVLPETHARELVESVERLENLDDMKHLVNLLQVSP
jgi:2-methylcitrate dehydratase PrpD